MRALAIAAIVLVAVVAHAQDDGIELQRMRFIERGQNLTANGNIAKLFDNAAYEALNSGFPSTIWGEHPMALGSFQVEAELRLGKPGDSKRLERRKSLKHHCRVV